MKSAYVIDDDSLSREFLAEAVATLGYRVREFGDGAKAIAQLSEEPDLVVCDLRLPEADGIEVLKASRRLCPDASFVLVTAYGTVERAVEAMRLGAEDFLMKPIAVEQLELVIRRIEKGRSLRLENKVLRAERLPLPRGPVITGEDPALLRALALVDRVAPTEATVLVRGESGTGKELVAERLHRSSGRAKGPLVRVNCAALTESLLSSELFGHEKGAFTGAVERKEGRFELAAGGTLFLDEIGELPLEVQSKLLRVLETGDFERVGGTRSLKSNARIVAATNRDLEAAMKAGRFREDLYFRLNVVPVWLPPLRDRVADIAPLAERFLSRYAVEYGSPAREFSTTSIDRLRACLWPGNVRELANVVQRAALVATSGVVVVEDLGLPDVEIPVEGGVTVGMSLEDMERALILKTLEAMGGARSRAAEALGVTTRTLSNKLRLWRQLGIPCPPPGRAPLTLRAEEEGD